MKKRIAYSYIRMSTDTQLKGDSLRRQTELAQKFAADRDWDLRPDTLHDIGLSGFTGENVERGQLGLFLRAVREKKVEPGSVLVVESLDRLSRKEPQVVLEMFLELLRNQVAVATVMDNKVYEPTADVMSRTMDLIMSILTMTRAHEESATKSKRLREAWARKREMAAQERRPMTRICPSWLRMKPDRSGYETIPERADVVRRVFRMYEEGVGQGRIAQMLNHEGVPSFGGRGWAIMGVKRILTSEAVVGRGQLGKTTADRKPLVDGKVDDYFPSVVDEDAFYRVKRRMTENWKGGRGGGRKGRFVTNLFSKIIRCGECGGRMKYENKGLHRYLVCAEAVRGMTKCCTTRWPYLHFETNALGLMREIDLQDVINQTGGLDRMHRLQLQRQGVEGNKLEAEKKRDRVYSMLIESDATDFLKQEFRKADREVADLNKQVDRLRKEERDLEAEETGKAYGQKVAPELIAKVQGSGEQSHLLRSSLAARLRDLIDEIRVYPGGRLVNRQKQNRCFVVKFRTGGVREVVVPMNQPERMIVDWEEIPAVDDPRMVNAPRMYASPSAR